MNRGAGSGALGCGAGSLEEPLNSAGGCTPQTTHRTGTLRQDPNTATSCAKVTYRPGQLQGRAGTGQHKPRQHQKGYDGRKRHSQHRLCVVRPRTHPEEVTPEKGKCYRAVQAGDTLVLQQQMLSVSTSLIITHSHLFLVRVLRRCFRGVAVPLLLSQRNTQPLHAYARDHLAKHRRRPCELRAVV